MKRIIKSIITKQLGRFGYRLVDIRNVHDDYGFINRLKAAGIFPETIIDVGVAHGTPYLYESFPNAKFHLFDPTRESLPFMQDWAKRIDAEIYNFGLGSKNDHALIKTRDTIQHATILRDETEPDLINSYQVEIKRLDAVPIDLLRPSLMKIDVEGFEMEVLKGLGKKIEEIDMFIIETSLNSLYTGGSDADEIVSHMKNLGFRVVDIAGITRRPKDGMVHQIDYVFAGGDSALAARGWA